MTPTRPELDVLSQLSWLDRLLPVWIFVAIGVGVLLGDQWPQTGPWLNSLQVGSVSLPIALGLIWMIYPPLAAVNYAKLREAAEAKQVIGLSLLLNWVVGPILMFALAWIFLPDLPGLRDGVILVGLARCIAMVLVWNMLAGGNNEHAAILVALNAAFQIVLYSVYAFIFLTVLSNALSPAGAVITVSVNPFSIALNVAVFLGIPLLLGLLSRTLLTRRKGAVWYESVFLPRLAPTALIALLFTLIVMFSLQGNVIVGNPFLVVRVAVPLIVYFAIMFISSYFLAWRLHLTYQDTVTVSFTAASNNFELAIAVAIASFGLASPQAFATIIGPLVEVPIMIGLVYLSLWLRVHLFARTMAERTVQPEGRQG